MEVALNPISGNDVAVDSVQHCQPSCLSSVLKGGLLEVIMPNQIIAEALDVVYIIA